MLLVLYLLLLSSVQVLDSKLYTLVFRLRDVVLILLPDHRIHHGLLLMLVLIEDGLAHRIMFWDADFLLLGLLVGLIRIQAFPQRALSMRGLFVRLHLQNN